LIFQIENVPAEKEKEAKNAEKIPESLDHYAQQSKRKLHRQKHAEIISSKIEEAITDRCFGNEKQNVPLRRIGRSNRHFFGQTRAYRES